MGTPDGGVDRARGPRGWVGSGPPGAVFEAPAPSDRGRAKGSAGKRRLVFEPAAAPAATAGVAADDSRDHSVFTFPGVADPTSMSEYAPEQPLGDPAELDDDDLDLDLDVAPSPTEDTVGLYLREIAPCPAAHRCRRGLAGQGTGARRPSGPPSPDRVEPAPGRLGRTPLLQPRPVVPRPHPGREPGPDEGGGALRLAARPPVLDLRDVVDPPVGDARACRPGPHDPRSGTGGRHDQPDGAHRAAADPEAAPDADQRGAGRGHGPQAGQDRAAEARLAGARVAGRTGRRGLDRARAS